jgi:hypothetical protein
LGGDSQSKWYGNDKCNIKILNRPRPGLPSDYKMYNGETHYFVQLIYANKKTIKMKM